MYNKKYNTLFLMVHKHSNPCIDEKKQKIQSIVNSILGKRTSITIELIYPIVRQDII